MIVYMEKVLGLETQIEVILEWLRICEHAGG